VLRLREIVQADAPILRGDERAHAARDGPDEGGGRDGASCEKNADVAKSRRRPALDKVG
jgi:hypothetical protein